MAREENLKLSSEANEFEGWSASTIKATQFEGVEWIREDESELVWTFDENEKRNEYFVGNPEFLGKDIKKEQKRVEWMNDKQEVSRLDKSPGFFSQENCKILKLDGGLTFYTYITSINKLR